MIAKIRSGGGFRGVLDYLMQQKKEGPEKRQSGGQEKQNEGAEKRPEGEERTSEIDPPEAGEKAVQHEPIDEPPEGEQAVREYAPDELSQALEDGRGERHQLIGGNMTGRTPRELAHEFGAFWEQRPDITKPVHHASLSAAPGERLGIGLWNEIAEKYIEKMGYANSPYIVIRHFDTTHEHVHIVTSRIDVNGKVISDFQSKIRAEEIMREVERDYDLVKVKPSREVERAAPTRSEIERFNRTGELSTKMSLQGHVDQALQDVPTTTDFIEKLNRVGVQVIPNMQSADQVSGISFRLGDELMKGSDLGRGYSWQGLQNRGLEYEQARDVPALWEAQIRSTMVPGEAPSFFTPVPGIGFTAPAPHIGKSAGEYLLDQANLMKQLETPATQIYEQLGQMIMSNGQNTVRNYQGLADANIEQLRRAAGLEPSAETSEIIERLNDIAGVDHTAQTLEGSLIQEETLEPVIQRTVEEETIELVIEIGIDL